MSEDITRVLDAIEQADTAGGALDAIPEDWGVFIAGRDNGEHACSMKPAGHDGVTGRIYDQGLVMGRGATRLEAVVAAVAWMRKRDALLTA